ncbi:hypothetical protein HDA32_005051 [Spinactinospora alkalitolerans]|uniref:Uncharacterized protein n=1 Tax=Spinactinospora alkalitolerans TaxID=687207 RepID=A0A852U1C5_9ACTN|nr:hypothetical protein [Spinactinospora alkalitolerans]NYE49931.1 hypothetical protein [Spinactinospora alkalitolerans]
MTNPRYQPRHARQASMIRPYLIAHERRQREADVRRAASFARRQRNALRVLTGAAS